MSTKDDLRKAIEKPISNQDTADDFEQHATANWIEEQIALDLKEGVLVRIVETRPLSKRKCWKVDSILASSQI